MELLAATNNKLNKLCMKLGMKGSGESSGDRKLWPVNVE